LTVSACTSTPVGLSLSNALKQKQSGTINVICTTTIQVSQTITLPQVPGFIINAPSGISTTTGTFFYAIQDPSVTTTTSFRTEGPASVNGKQLTFNPSPNPLTLTSGVRYAFAFYQLNGPPSTQYSLVQNIGVPNVPSTPAFSFDISFVDSTAGQYYLADRTNAGVDVFDVKANKLIGAAKGFKGFPGNNNNAGPNGVVPIGGGLLAAGDGDSTLKIVNVGSLSVVATQLSAKNPFTGTIPTQVSAGCVNPAGGETSNAFRLDEMAFDPADAEVLAINDADCPPYGTFFSSKAPFNVLGSVSFGTSFNGVEQPIWDPGTRMFLQANPQTVANPNGELDMIDPHTFHITNVFPLTVNCIPHGLALGPNEHAVVGCNAPLSQILIVNATNGQTVASIPGYGGSDECWYNQGDNRFYCALSSQTPNALLIVIDAGTNQLLGTITTSTGAHSVAADSATNHVFVPQTAIGISVFGY
jgi:hypothetical protein